MLAKDQFGNPEAHTNAMAQCLPVNTFDPAWYALTSPAWVPHNAFRYGRITVHLEIILRGSSLRA